MSKILDDHEFNLKPKKEEPNPKVGTAGFVLFFSLFVTQIVFGETSETALVEGSYIWMPCLTMGLLGFIVPPKKAIIAGVLTVPITFLFYTFLWPAF